MGRARPAWQGGLPWLVAASLVAAGACLQNRHPPPSATASAPLLRKLRAASPIPAAGSERASLTFVSGNANKLAEVRLLLDSAGLEDTLEVQSHDLDLPELQGDPVDISREKCRLAAAIVGGPVLVDDTSLAFNALGGLPGPYIKWFSETIGNEGLHRLLHGFDDKSAFCQCTLSFSPDGGSEVTTFVGRAHGRIVAPRGRPLFGWDPLFELEDGRTFAEMSREEKNAVSHRGKAVKKFVAHLRQCGW